MKNSKIQLMSNVEGKTIPEMKNSYVWVDTEFKLKELADVLSKECVFAVDTEQHSLHSFLGFTALIQVGNFVITCTRFVILSYVLHVY